MNVYECYPNEAPSGRVRVRGRDDGKVRQRSDTWGGGGWSRMDV